MPTYDGLKAQYEEEGWGLPTNSGSARKSCRLDELVVNALVETAGKHKIDFQTIRMPFMEGRPAFPGSGIKLEPHIQLAVRDSDCILGVFRPHFDRGTRGDEMGKNDAQRLAEEARREAVNPTVTKLSKLRERGVIDAQGRVLLKGPGSVEANETGASTSRPAGPRKRK